MKLSRKALPIAAIALLFATNLYAEVAVKHGKIQLTFPEQPRASVEEITSDGQTSKQHRLMIEKPDGAIIVFKQTDGGAKDVQAALKKLCVQVCKVAGSAPAQERDVKLSGNPGRLLLVRIPSNGGWFRVAYFHIDDHFYQVMAVGTKEFLLSDSVNTMFASVSVVE